MKQRPEREVDRPRCALDGIRVIELPFFGAMPYLASAMAGKVLADLGAEVIKVEPPANGAVERRMGPFRGQKRNPEAGGLHVYLNTNKLSVTLDLENARERSLFVDTLGWADILLNPNMPAFNERLRFDWRTLTARFPRLIVVSLAFFGIESPYRDLLGGDLIANHMSGVGYGTPMNQVIDPANQPPLKLAGRQSDYLTGYIGAAAAMCALFHRERTGAGQHVEASQWLSMAAMVRPEISVYTHESSESPYRQRLLIRRKTSLQFLFPCKDGWVSCGLASDRHWRGAKRMMGNPEWADGEMFDSLHARLGNSDALEAALTAWMADLTKREIFEKAQAEHVPCFPVNSPAEVASNEQYLARGFFIDHCHTAAGALKMPGAPYILSRTPWRIRRAAPRLGEHSREVLQRRNSPLGDGLAVAAGEAGRVESVASHSARRSVESASPPRLPFEGIRVADFGWIYALPYAMAWLGALGADVIRMESTLAPDLVRFLSGTDGVGGINRSGIFNGLNVSRRSLLLNLTRPEGAEIARRLVRISDIAVENFTAGTMKRFSLGYEELSRIKPDLVMVSGSSLGQTGPLAKSVGWGPTNQAFAGIGHLTGYPGGFPSGLGGTWPDFAVGTVMFYVTVAALRHRDRTGEGQYIDLSMTEVVTSMLPEAMMDFFMNGRNAGPIGNRDKGMAPHGVFPVAGEDRWVAIAVATDEEFAALCDALGVPAMCLEPRYATNAARLANVEVLEREIAALTRDRDRDKLVPLLRARNLAAAPVYSIEELMHDPVFLDSGMLVKLRHKESGERLVPGLPVRFGAFRPDYRPAPLIGEHTEEVLGDLLGYGAKEIARLRADKVII